MSGEPKRPPRNGKKEGPRRVDLRPFEQPQDDEVKKRLKREVVTNVSDDGEGVRLIRSRWRYKGDSPASHAQYVAGAPLDPFCSGNGMSGSWVGFTSQSAFIALLLEVLRT